jgi:PAS domain S-box-containing protein
MENKPPYEELQSLQAVFKEIHIGLYIYHLEDISDDRTLRMIDANQATADFTGVPIKDVVGKTLDHNFPGLRKEGIPQIYADVVRSGNARTLENVVYGDDRVVQGVFLVKAFPLPNNCVGVSFENISERKQTEEALRKSEEKFRLMFETMFSGFALLEMMYDESGNPVDCRYMEANPAHEKLTGLKTSEIVGRTARDCIPGLEDSWIDNYGHVDRTGKSMEIENFVEGLNNWYKVFVYRPKPGFVAVTFENITERKQAEEALRENEERYRSFFDKGPDGVVVLDPKTAKPIEFNDQVCRQLGYSREEFALLRLSDIDTAETAEETKAHIRKVLSEGFDDFETLQRTKQGKIRHVHITAQVIEISGSPVYHCIWRDITARRQAEEEKNKLETQLKQAQKMEAIGTLAGGIAHDFNNILSPIMIHSEMALMDLPPRSPLKENMRQIYKAGERATDLVKQILTFARKHEDEQIPLKVSRILKEAIKLLRSSIPTTIDIQYHINSEQDTVLSDPTRLNQIIMNLCTNAAHAMEENGGTLEVILTNENIDSDSADGFPDLEPGRYVKLTVKDTGQGIEPQFMDKIFEPYFTTKEVGKGTGMGLSLVHGIVKSYGGAVSPFKAKWVKGQASMSICRWMKRIRMSLQQQRIRCHFQQEQSGFFLLMMTRPLLM